MVCINLLTHRLIATALAAYVGKVQLVINVSLVHRSRQVYIKKKITAIHIYDPKDTPHKVYIDLTDTHTDALCTVTVLYLNSKNISNLEENIKIR